MKYQVWLLLKKNHEILTGKLFLMFLPQMNQNTDDTIFKIVLATEMQIKGVKYDNYTILLTQ